MEWIFFAIVVLIAIVTWAIHEGRKTRVQRVSIPASKRHFKAQVHGIEHRNDDGSSRQAIIRRCAVGEQLELVPDPGNKYDEDAIKICRRNGEQLGYWSGGDGGRARRAAADGSRGRVWPQETEEVVKITLG